MVNKPKRNSVLTLLVWPNSVMFPPRLRYLFILVSLRSTESRWKKPWRLTLLRSRTAILLKSANQITRPHRIRIRKQIRVLCKFRRISNLFSLLIVTFEQVKQWINFDVYCGVLQANIAGENTSQLAFPLSRAIFFMSAVNQIDCKYVRDCNTSGRQSLFYWTKLWATLGSVQFVDYQNESIWKRQLKTTKYRK